MSEQSKVKKLPSRSEIKVEDTWKLEDIFASDDAWEKEFEEVKALIPQMEKFKGKLGESAQTLYDALQEQDELTMRVSKLYTYAHMRYDQDTTNSFYQGLNDRIKTLYTQIASALSYVTPEILSIEESKIKQYMAEHKELKLYAHALDEITREVSYEGVAYG